MAGARWIIVTFKVLELILSIITAAAVIFTEISSDTSNLKTFYCFTTLAVSGMVAFLSLAYLCTICTHEVFSRPAMLLAAAIGAFLFFTIALHIGIKQLSQNTSISLSVLVLILCLATAIVLYVDACIMYCTGPLDVSHATVRR